MVFRTIVKHRKDEKPEGYNHCRSFKIVFLLKFLSFRLSYFTFLLRRASHSVGVGMPFAKPFSFKMSASAFIRHFAFGFSLFLLDCRFSHFTFSPADGLPLEPRHGFLQRWAVLRRKNAFHYAFLFHSLAKLRISKCGNFVLKSFRHRQIMMRK